MTCTAKTSRLHLESLEDREVPAILFGVTTTNQLVAFDSANPSVLLSSFPIQGFFATGEVITDIDVRPGTGALYGRSNFDRLFLINPQNPLALPVGNPVPVSAQYVGFDFDPRNDNIRVLSNQGENLVLNSVNGSLVTVGASLSYAAGDLFQGIQPRITGEAYLNSVPGATTTGIFMIDHARNTLVRPASGTTMNEGLLATVGGLGIDVGPRVGFDIAPTTNTSFASFQFGGQGISRLFTLNLGTGRATLLGRVGGGLVLNDIAVDLRGTSGFTSAAGFGALPPPQGLFSASFSSTVFASNLPIASAQFSGVSFAV
jgi:hypothetical protein